MEPSHLLTEVIRPVLRRLELWSEDAERLLLGTACAESNCGQALKQITGPALGIYQCEPATHEDIWNHFLRYRGDKLVVKINYWRICYSNGAGAQELTGNLYYATAICRIHYLRVKEPIPSTLREQAAYWKEHYNTHKGAGSVDGYLSKWDQFVGRGTMIGDPFLRVA
jgi:hypothetical protein